MTPCHETISLVEAKKKYGLLESFMRYLAIRGWDTLSNDHKVIKGLEMEYKFYRMCLNYGWKITFSAKGDPEFDFIVNDEKIEVKGPAHTLDECTYQKWLNKGIGLVVYNDNRFYYIVEITDVSKCVYTNKRSNGKYRRIGQYVAIDFFTHPEHPLTPSNIVEEWEQREEEWLEESWKEFNSSGEEQ